jgi:hypothetical protein
MNGYCVSAPPSPETAPEELNLTPAVPVVITLDPLSSYAGSVTQIALTQPPQGKTGPEVVVVMASGAAAGFAWIRRKRRR